MRVLVSQFLGFWVSWFLGFSLSCLGFKCDPVGFRSVWVASFLEGLGWGC